MSIQSLLHPNTYNLFCNTITPSSSVVTPNLIYHTLTQDNGNSSVDVIGNITNTGAIDTQGQITSTVGFFTPASLQADFQVTTGILTANEQIVSLGPITASGIINANDGISALSSISTTGPVIADSLQCGGGLFQAFNDGSLNCGLINNVYTIPLQPPYFFVQSTTATLSAVEVLGQIVLSITTAGSITLTLPDSVDVFAQILAYGQTLSTGSYFTFKIFTQGTGVNTVTLASSADNKFQVNSSIVVANNSTREVTCVVFDPTNASMPSILAF